MDNHTKNAAFKERRFHGYKNHESSVYQAEEKEQ